MLRPRRVYLGVLSSLSIVFSAQYASAEGGLVSLSCTRPDTFSFTPFHMAKFCFTAQQSFHHSIKVNWGDNTNDKIDVDAIEGDTICTPLDQPKTYIGSGSHGTRVEINGATVYKGIVTVGDDGCSIQELFNAQAGTFGKVADKAPTAAPTLAPTTCVPTGDSCTLIEDEEGSKLPDIPCCTASHACIELPNGFGSRCIATDPPTDMPTEIHSTEPSGVPSSSPTATKSNSPSVSASDMPSHSPSASLSASPSASPTQEPTKQHSSSPSTEPSHGPTFRPTPTPSVSHSNLPSARPSVTPTITDSSTPSLSPSISHSNIPSARPSATPEVPASSAVESLAVQDDNTDCGLNIDIKCSVRENESEAVDCSNMFTTPREPNALMDVTWTYSLRYSLRNTCSDKWGVIQRQHVQSCTLCSTSAEISCNKEMNIFHATEDNCAVMDSTGLFLGLHPGCSMTVSVKEKIQVGSAEKGQCMYTKDVSLRVVEGTATRPVRHKYYFLAPMHQIEVAGFNAQAGTIGKVADKAPTAAPTLAQEYYPINPVPQSPPRGYFNYDINSRYGPNNWHTVDTSRHWLEEFSPDGFGAWNNFHEDDLTSNICGGRDRKQSPKDLIEIEECDAHHEIRTECARYPLSDDEFFEKAILPHKLSIISKRRRCRDLEDPLCLRDRPPMADYPKYASGKLNFASYSDMHHFDIKVPGEHTIDGEEFDAEIQIFHTHLTIARLSSIGIPIRAVDDGHNVEYQVVLNEFQEVYDRHAEECAQHRRNHNLRPTNETTLDYSSKNKETNETTLDYLSKNKETMDQNLLSRNFDPYSDAFMTTMYFYRYDGSITEPPCRDITWWVMDGPMNISHRQLSQTKRLLFSHVDSNCGRTSVHNADQSVARPIQPLGMDRVIQHCKEGDFISDVSKGRPPAKRCRG